MSCTHRSLFFILFRVCAFVYFYSSIFSSHGVLDSQHLVVIRSPSPLFHYLVMSVLDISCLYLLCTKTHSEETGGGVSLSHPSRATRSNLRLHRSGGPWCIVESSVASTHLSCSQTSTDVHQESWQLSTVWNQMPGPKPRHFRSHPCFLCRLRALTRSDVLPQSLLPVMFVRNRLQSTRTRHPSCSFLAICSPQNLHFQMSAGISHYKLVTTVHFFLSKIRRV